MLDQNGRPVAAAQKTTLPAGAAVDFTKLGVFLKYSTKYTADLNGLAL